MKRCFFFIFIRKKQLFCRKNIAANKLQNAANEEEKTMKKRWSVLAALFLTAGLTACAGTGAEQTQSAAEPPSAVETEAVSYTHLDVYKRQVRC